MDSKDNGVFYHLNCRICGRTFWSEDGFADVCDECKDNKNQFNNYVEDSKVLAKCVICGEYIEVEKADCVWIKVCDDCKRAIEWAKKQEPVNPEFLPHRKFGCPKCKSVIRLGNPYCWNCGQSLNWT